MLEITINGESQQLPQAINVVELLQQMRLGDKRVAVERNGEIIPRSRYTATEIAHGDQLEIVVAVGGG